MSWPTHDAICDAECIHNVERRERHMRSLEDVAAGIEYKVRSFARLCGRAILQTLVDILAKAREVCLIELHARKNVHPIGNQAKILNALSAAIPRLECLPGNGDARHRQQEARVDAIIACRDAVTSKRTAFGP